METFEDRLAALKQELIYYGNEISRQLSCINSNGKTAVDLKSDPRNALVLLQHEVSEMLHEAQSTDEYLEKNQAELDSCSSFMSVLLEVSSTADCLSRCEDSINKCEIESATVNILELKRKVKLLPQLKSELGTGVVCSSLRRESQIQTFRHISRLQRLVRNCVTIEPGRICVSKSLKGILRGEDILISSPIDLSSVWDSLRMMSCAQECISSVVSDCWRLVLKPLWRERKFLAPRIIRTDEVSELEFEVIARDNIGLHLSNPVNAGDSTPNSSLGACRMPFPQLLEQISSVLNFMWSEIFGCKEELTNAIRSALQDSAVCLSQTLVDTLLALLPKTEADVLHFQKQVEKPCREFEGRLKALGLAYEAEDGARGNSSSTSSSLSQGETAICASQLSDVMTALTDHFAVARRRDFLSRARDLILADYHNTMLASGDANEDDPASAGDVGDQRAILEKSGSFSMQSLRFESCQVSLASCRLLKLINEVLQQACQSSPELAVSLYETGRECLELFMAVVPMRFAEVIEVSPRMGGVFFNDCCYIAHNSTLITHSYKQSLSQANDKLLGALGLVDFIPRFRSLGESCLSRHLEAQKCSLSELVSKINIKTEVEDGKVSEASTGASRLLAGGLQLAGRMGIGAIQRATGSDERSVKSLVNTWTGSDRSLSSECPNDLEAAGLVVRHLERLGAEWQGVLQDSVYDRLMSHLLENTLRLAMAPVLESDCITERAGADISAVFRYLQKSRSVFGTTDEDKLASLSSSWKKFCALTDLLEYSLIEVAEWLPRRKFSSFTGPEMTSLIKSLFEDSPKRSGILASIADMSS